MTFTSSSFKNKLLTLEGLTPDFTRGDVDFYTVVENKSDNVSDFIGQTFGSFNITAIGTVTSSTYNFYATSSSSTLIKTQVEIKGNSTMSSLIVPVTITSSTINS